MAVKKLAGLVKQSSKKVEGERCEHVQLCATARSFNVRPRAGRAVPSTNCGGEEKQQQRTPRIRFLKCFCHKARGIFVLVQWEKQLGAGYSAAKGPEGLSGEDSKSPGLDTRGWRGRNVTVRLFTRIYYFSFFYPYLELQQRVLSCTGTFLWSQQRDDSWRGDTHHPSLPPPCPATTSTCTCHSD